MRGGFRQFVFQKSVFLKHPNKHFQIRVLRQVKSVDWKGKTVQDWEVGY